MTTVMKRYPFLELDYQYNKHKTTVRPKTPFKHLSAIHNIKRHQSTCKKASCNIKNEPKFTFLRDRGHEKYPVLGVESWVMNTILIKLRPQTPFKHLSNTCLRYTTSKGINPHAKNEHQK